MELKRNKNKNISNNKSVNVVNFELNDVVANVLQSNKNNSITEKRIVAVTDPNKFQKTKNAFR